MVEVPRAATQQQLAAAIGYASLLDEAMGRIASIEHAIAGGLGLSPALVREFSYLQIRMLCELIALGCLIAHGDIPETQSGVLQGAWSADRIIRRLENLHPNFYPHPVRIITTPGHVHIDRMESGFLAKRNLLTLYHRCGDILHRGSLDDLASQAEGRASPDYSDIVGWTNMIIRLLEQHHIASADNNSHLICALKSNDMGGHASVAIALSPLPT